jgi:M6 family metalloprotease-like protein
MEVRSRKSKVETQWLVLAMALVLTFGAGVASACLGQDGRVPDFISIPTDLSKQPGRTALSQIGSQNTLVIQVDFANCYYYWDQLVWYWRVTQDNTAPICWSVRDYYQEVSYHLTYNFPGLDLPPAAETSETDNNGIAGCYHMNFNHPFTTTGDTFWPNRMHESLPGAPPHCRDSMSMGQQLAWLALKAADHDVNFWAFQTGGPSDLSISSSELHVIIIVAGHEASYAGLDSFATWRHHWAIPGVGYCSQDGPYGCCYVGGASYGGGYSMLGERSPTNQPLGMGLIAHEMGHDLGLPDLYDTDGATNGYGDGVGEFCLMAGGDWLGYPGGYAPAQLCAWAKIDEGWITPTKVWNQDSLNATIPAVESAPVVYRMNPFNQPTSKQYFLIENRQLKLTDRCLPGNGLLICHVDDSTISRYRGLNTINTRVGYTNALHYGVDVECQDGFPAGAFLDHLDVGNDGNRGDTGDPWFSQPNFNSVSTPGSNFYYGVTSCAAVESIGASADPMRANLVYHPSWDVGVTGILAPGALVVKDSSVATSAKVKNFGANAATFNAVMTIGSWTGTANVSNLATGEERTVSFGAWVASQTGDFTVKCSTQLAGDLRPSNDAKTSSVTVSAASVNDVGVLRITSPTGSCDSSVAVTPAAKVKNSGTASATFKAFFKINNGSAYSDSVGVPNLAAGDSATAFFSAWAKPHAPASYTTRCSTYYASDNNHGNDTIGGTFTVTCAGRHDTWYPKPPFPPGRGKGVKDGGSLAYGSGRDGSGLVYATKGNNTGEFCQYDAGAGSWSALETIPPFGHAGKKKYVKKGASMAQIGDKLYLAKGNNTLEFWCYDPSAHAWTQMADVPTGSKNVKEGSGMIGVSGSGSNYIYFLKGSGTLEFLRYNVATNAWESRADAPLGASNKAFKNGSCITGDGSNAIYGLKGSYNEFFAYDVANNAWSTLTAMPFKGASGSKKKVKDGAGIAYLGSAVYAIKGGNTREFWTYSISSGAWTQGNDIPVGGGKKVKGGGALVAGGDALFATKGNNTSEFYEITPPAAFNSQPVAHSTNQMINSPLAIRHSPLAVSPNPFSRTANIRFSLPQHGAFSLKLYNMTGKLVKVVTEGKTASGSSDFGLRISDLPQGIYLLRFEAAGGCEEIKLVVTE